MNRVYVYSVTIHCIIPKLQHPQMCLIFDCLWRDLLYLQLSVSTSIYFQPGHQSCWSQSWSRNHTSTSPASHALVVAKWTLRPKALHDCNTCQWANAKLFAVKLPRTKLSMNAPIVVSRCSAASLTLCEFLEEPINMMTISWFMVCSRYI